MLKKDAEMAPTNWFRTSRRRQNLRDSDVIVVDADEDESERHSDIEIVDVGFDPNLSPKCLHSLNHPMRTVDTILL